MKPTAAALLAQATQRLAAAGVPDARRDALVLLAAATGLDRGALVTDSERCPPAAALARFGRMIERRAAREPVSLILGTREFWSLPFRVTPDTLTPRPETETLVDAALAALPDRGRAHEFLDLGTGTGCLLAALLSEYPRARGVAVDISPAAAAVARWNLADLGLAGRAAVLAADWTTALAPALRFDLVIANPPYVESGAPLPPEVANFDPATALYAGPTGLDAYARLLPGAAAHLTAGGFLLLELGAGQLAAVADLARRAGLDMVAARPDLAGIPRGLILKKFGSWS